MVGTVIVSYIRLWHWWFLMWTRYTYVCSFCDALIEITSEVIPVVDPTCICNTALKPTYLGQEDATVDEEETVTSITYTDVVKINTNPYN